MARHRFSHWQTALDRFWDYVAYIGAGPDECWLWTGPQHAQGYGQFSLGAGRNILAHRFAFALANGVEAGEQVNHHCDVTLCVRPDHIYDGSAKQNTADMDRRGRRGRKGDRRWAR